MYTGPGSEKTWNFEKYLYDPKRKCDELEKQRLDVNLVQKHPILKRCINFQKRELKKGGGDSAVTMMMDFTSSANDFCIVFGMCLFWKDE